MVIDKKGKLFGKVSIVDILVILVIIVGITGAYFALSTLNSGKLNDNSKLALNASTPVQEATVTLKLKEVRSMTRDAIKEGDEIYETEDSKFIGTINQVSFERSAKTLVSNSGTVHNSEIPEKYDVTVTIDVTGKQTDNGFYTESGVQLLYGKDIEIRTSSVKTTPEIVGIEIK